MIVMILVCLSVIKEFRFRPVNMYGKTVRVVLKRILYRKRRKKKKKIDCISKKVVVMRDDLH